MTNEFKIEGKILGFYEDRSLRIQVSKSITITMTYSPKIKIEKYNIGKMVEISGYLTSFKPLCIPQIVATKIVEK